MDLFSRLTSAVAFFACAFSLNADAQPYQYHVYLDADLRESTGCAVTGPGGQSFAGADYRLTTIVSGSPPRATGRRLAACAGGVFPAVTPTAVNYPVGLNNGVPVPGGQADVIESMVPRSALPGVLPQVRVAFAAQSETGSIDVLFTNNGLVGGTPMILGSPLAVPTIGLFAALFLAFALSFVAFRTLKKNRGLAQMMLVCAFFSLGFAAWAANHVVDGLVGDWTGASPLGTDPINDSVPPLAATDIAASFGADEAHNLYFRLDVVDAENRPPVAVNDAYTTREDQPLNIAAPGVLANDSDPDGNPTTAQLMAGPTRGTLTLNPNGGFLYTPNANINGTDSFTYNAHDGQAASQTPATVTITITPVNDVPVFTAGRNETVLEDAGAQTVNPWATGISDGDPEVTQNLSFNITNNTNAALFSAGPVVSPTGVLTYTPAANANGVATITLNLSDDGGTANGGVNTSATQTFTITVTAVNDTPTFTAGPNQIVNEDAGAQAVLGWATAMNDGDPELTQVLNFTATVTGMTSNLAFTAPPAIDASTGNLTYTATANTNGVATIEVRLVDNGSNVAPNVNTSAPQTFTITVSAINDAPRFVVGPNQTVNEDAGAQTVNSWASALDDGDPELTQVLSFTITNNTNAALFSAGPAVSATGALSYTPATNANGTATITLRINDDGGSTPPNVNQSATQTFTITVNAINDAPSFVVGPNQTVAEDTAAQSVNPWATAISPGPIDEVGQTVSFAVTNNTNAALFAAGGLPAISPTGVLTFTPAANAFGVATITLTIADNGLGAPPPNANTSAPQTFTIAVTAINDAPVLTAGGMLAYVENQAATAIDTTVTVNDVDDLNLMSAAVAITTGFQTTQDVLACGTCAGGITANYVSATGILTLSGSATLGAYQTALRSVTYRNSSDNPSTAPRTITWVGNDGALPSAPVTSTVIVAAVDDPPTAVNDAASVLEDAAATAVAVLANDTDPDAGPISITGVTQPANGSVVITGGGTGLTYRPNANYCNTPPGTTLSTFTYTLNGGSTATVSMTVTCVDDPPTAVNDSATVAEDSGATAVAVLANDTDIDAGPISITSVTQPTNGTVVITGGGAGLTYAPNLNFCDIPPPGPADTFTYTLIPGGSSATVSITVTCVDDAPVAVNDTATVIQGSGSNSIPVLANDTDVDAGPISITSVTQPVNGTVVITSGGTGLTYEPNAGYCNDTPPGTPSSTFTYTLTPGGSTGTVSVTVVCDVPPVAVPDVATVVEDSGANAVNVLANDTDVDGGPLSVASVTQPANGVVMITGGGTGLTYQPNPNYCNAPPGTMFDTFSYTLAPGSSSATVTMTVSCVDDNPVAVADSATVVEDSGAIAIPVLANDADIDAGPISIGSVTQPANGSVVITGGGTGLTYAPNANYCNTPPGTTFSTFTYTLNGGSSTTVTVTVTCVDDNPVAVADSATVAEDSGAIAITVLANDTDIDAGPISITSATQPTNGAVLITGGGTGLTYAPNANYCDTPPPGPADTFTYTLAPGGSVATVTVTVTCVDDPPVAVDDSATVGQNTGANAIAVLANDTDIDAGPIGIQSVTQPANGTVVITGGGTGLTYMPTPAYCNNPPGTLPSSFTYTLNGGSTAAVSVLVNCDTPPTAVNDSATVLEDAAATAVLVLANDTDPDGGPISITSVTQPANGAVVITGGGTGLTYAPNPNYCDTPPPGPADTFTYTLTPGGSTATVSMTVTCVDDNPVAVADSATVNEDSGANAIAVLANDTDFDGGAISITSVTQPANGSVVITGGGMGLTYTPSANYCNSPSGTTLSTFTYTLTPGGSSTSVTVTVICIDDNPVAVADAATVVEDSGANVVAVLANDTDVDGGPISITGVTQPANGVVVIIGGGTGLTYAPNANFCDVPPPGPADTFTYTLTPGGSVATVSMTVTCVDDLPVAVDDAATVAEDSGAAAVTVLTNDTDIDAGPKTIQSVTQPTNGAVVITGGGTGLTYAPNLNYCNSPPGTTPDTFTYALNGGSIGTVTMTVTCVNDAPINGIPGTQTFNEDTSLIFTGGNTITVSDVDIAAGNLTVTLSSASGVITMTPTGGVTINNNGTTSVNATGNVVGLNNALDGTVFTPIANLNGARTISMVTNDNGNTGTPGAQSDTDTINLTITAINDEPTYTIAASSAAVLEDAGLQSVAGFASAISAGPADEVGQTLTFALTPTGTTNGLTFSGPPSIAANGTLTYTSAANSFGTASFDVVLTDNGLAAPPPNNNTGATTSITITVNPVNDPPVALNKAHATHSGVGLTINAATDTGELMEGVTDVDDPIGDITVDTTLITLTPGGATGITATVTNATNGSFFFEGPGGLSGAAGVASFQYRVCDDGNVGLGLAPACSAYQTVSFTITGPDLWFFDSTPAVACTPNCNGSFRRPFAALSSLPAVATRGAGDRIFVANGTYTSGHTFAAGEHLIGDGATGTLATLLGVVAVGNGTLDALGSPSGTAPTLQNITAANSTLLRGVAISSGGSIGYSAPTGTTSIAVSQTSVTAANTAVSIVNTTTGTVGGVTGVNFASTTSTAGVNGILLTTASGTYNFGVGALSGHSGAAFSLDNSAAGTQVVTANYGGTVTSGTGRSVLINSADAGSSVAFSGAISDTDLGLSMTNSTGATITFSGGLVASTGTNIAFNASGGGTVNVCDDAACSASVGLVNTLATTTGVALNVVNTTIGANGLAFRSIGSNGAVSGIVLNSVGAGPLTVSGAGSGTTGGTIRNSTGPGILLTNTGVINLAYMSIADGNDDGIRGNTVGGFNLTSVSITNNGNATGENGIEMSELYGTGGMTNCTVSGSADNNVSIRNDTTANNLTIFNVTSSTFSGTSATTGNDGFLIENNGSGAMTVGITNSFFTDNRGDHFQAAADATAAATASMNVTFTGNTLNTTAGADPNVLGGGVTLTPSGAMDMIFNVSNNNIQQAFSAAIAANLGTASTATASMVGTINGNVIGSSGAIDSGSESSDGIEAISNGAGSATVAITNNQIFQYANDAGIKIIVRDGTTSMNATVTGNTVANPGSFAANGVHAFAGAVATDNGHLCLTLTGNTTTGSGFGGASDIRLRQRFSTTIRLPGYGGANNDMAAVGTFVQGNNPGAETFSATHNVPTGGGFTGGVACPMP